MDCSGKMSDLSAMQCNNYFDIHTPWCVRTTNRMNMTVKSLCFDVQVFDVLQHTFSAGWTRRKGDSVATDVSPILIYRIGM